MNWNDMVNERKLRLSLPEIVAKMDLVEQLQQNLPEELKAHLEKELEEEMGGTFDVMYKQDKAETAFKENQKDVERDKFRLEIMLAKQKNLNQENERQPC